MPSKDLSEIIVILDRSGSMEPLKRDMEGGFDAFIAEQRGLPGQCKVTLVQFDNVVETVYQGIDLAQVAPLALHPRHGTALYDAIGFTLDAVGARLSHTADEARPERVLVVILTDGEENASRSFSRDHVLSRIQHRREVDGWELVYLGANQDAFAVGRALGIHHAYGFASTPAGTRILMDEVSTGVKSYRAGSGYTAPTTTPGSIGPDAKRGPGGGSDPSGGSKLN